MDTGRRGFHFFRGEGSRGMTRGVRDAHPPRGAWVLLDIYSGARISSRILDFRGVAVKENKFRQKRVPFRGVNGVGRAQLLGW